jgi:hypothetical protein
VIDELHETIRVGEEEKEGFVHLKVKGPQNMNLMDILFVSEAFPRIILHGCGRARV